jgi:hypothetical protein
MTAKSTWLGWTREIAERAVRADDELGRHIAFWEFIAC